MKLKPVRSRKYCLNLLFAGNKFSQYGFKKNALRCFLITNSYYSTTKWHILNEYSYLQLARFFFDVKNYYKSVVYQKYALNEAKSLDSIDKHNNIVNEFARILKTIDLEKKNNLITEDFYQKIFEDSENIYLPKLFLDKVDIFLDNDNCFRINSIEDKTMTSYADFYNSNSLDLDGNDSNNTKWSDLLEKINIKNKDHHYQMNMLSSIREKNNFRLYDCRFLERKNQLFNKKERFCFVGDVIFIVLEFENPLKILLDIKNIKPLYEFEPLSGNPEKNISMKKEESSEYLDIFMEKIEIPQLTQGKKCLLKIIPKIPGKLKVIGVQWNLFKMKTQIFFDFKGKKMKDGIKYDKNLKNIFEIFPNSSNLKINVDNFEENIYFGEIKKLNLTMKNDGAQKIKKLFLATSHPNFFGFSCKKFEDFEFNPGEVKVLTMMIRGSNLQKSEIKLLFKYILEENVHKTIRIILPLKVIFCLPIYNKKRFSLPSISQHMVIN